MTDAPVNLLNFDRDGLTHYFEEIGERPFRAQQIMKWIYHEHVTDFEKMTNLSKVLRTKLIETASIKLPNVVFHKKAADGTIKWLLTLADGNAVEMVFIPEGRRGTLCVSSQVGCTLNCHFCSTGKQGFNRNLSTAEIIGQVLICDMQLTDDDPALTNIVLMGMGEPLYNYDNVLPATRLMTEDLAFGLSKRKVTLSSAGVVPMLEQLKKDSDIALAISLHAPTDELRDVLVPLNKKYPLKELMGLCKDYFPVGSRRSITFEYVMLKGVNDSPAHARQLIKLLKGFPAKVNLIPFNPFPNTVYERSSQTTIDKFRGILSEAGLTTITRRTRGDDIDAACGQLVGEFKDKTKRSIRFANQARRVNEAIA